MRSTGVRAGAMDVIPDSPLSHEEIRELHAFLMSDATPDECMDVVTLDGFLTALAIGPELVPPSVWLPLVWGGEKEPVFESSAQAERIIGILMHRFNDICRMFCESAAGFGTTPVHERSGREHGMDWRRLVRRLYGGRLPQLR